ncbi:hypothetical protein CGZ90_16000 [Fictibacillus aquaticus]|uniref:Phytase-like domain-containing protein n=2 Tax=Fictibacillus aquaticus TaxID=2021314 RepID=A0A235F5Q5_9BACL|nr:hypothetical protein CGZ90_16000 [Fictibacillus aquaticus]
MKRIILAAAAALTIGSAATAAFANSNTSSSDSLADSFQQLSRENVWEQKEKLNLQFNTFHPQGMTKIGDLYYMSSVEVTEKPVKYGELKDGYDRSPGKGIGHLFVFDNEGKLKKDIKLGEGQMYHPGGIAFDGKSIWVSVAEYRPNSESIIYKVDPETMKSNEVFRTDDHIGGIVHDDKSGKLKAVSWGSRTFYEFNETGKIQKKSKNSSHFIDYQDCEDAGNDKLICSGVTELPQPAPSPGKYELGGLALLDSKTMDVEHELPISLFSPQGHSVTRNPVFLEQEDERIKLYTIPDDDQSSLLVYDTSLNK